MVLIKSNRLTAPAEYSSHSHIDKFVGRRSLSVGKKYEQENN
jgi:hypothetical protein